VRGPTPPNNLQLPFATEIQNEPIYLIDRTKRLMVNSIAYVRNLFNRPSSYEPYPSLTGGLVRLVSS
jgi:hypothetical protein